MNVEELRTELRIRNVAHGGATKPDLQRMVMWELGFLAQGLLGNDSTMLGAKDRDADPSRDDPKPAVETQVESDPTVTMNPRVGVQPLLNYFLPPPNRPTTYPRVRESSQDSVSLAELQFDLEVRSLEFEAQQRQLEREAAEREAQLKFELRKLELQHTSQGPLSAHRDTPPRFKVEDAVRLIPKFNENDVETFLISFEKIAALNNISAGQIYDNFAGPSNWQRLACFH